MKGNGQRVVMVALLLLAGGAHAQSTTPAPKAKAPKGEGGAAPGRESPPAKVQEPAVAPQAEQLVRDASDYLKASQQLSFHADITFDDLLPTGQKIQLAAAYDAAVRRPDRVYTEYWGDAGSRRFWYDGKTITLYDPTLGLFASEPAKPSIDATLDYLIKEIGFSPPLSDLMTSDPYSALRKNVLFGFYVGVTEVDGVRCHHLAFVEQNIDWQIWIEDGTQWVPRKLVITYKTLPGAPQFSAVLSDWDFATRPPDALFTPQLPAGAARISFLTAAAASKGKGGGGRTK
jgi:hypothetical protein